MTTPGPARHFELTAAALARLLALFDADPIGRRSRTKASA